MNSEHLELKSDNHNSKKNNYSKKGNSNRSNDNIHKNSLPKSSKSSRSSKGFFSGKNVKNNRNENTNKSERKFNKSRKKDGGKKYKQPKKSLKIGFLGGLNEIGKNITVYEYDDEIIIVDCGLAFPEADMFGVDMVIPDFSYLVDNMQKIKGVFITHGHEDHIGSLAYFLNILNVPVYGTELTIGLIEGKLVEHNLKDSAKLSVIKPGSVTNTGAFAVEAIHVNHSIPDALAFAIKCKAGTVIHMGDFKIDSTPIDGGMIDLNRLGKLGDEGVLCLLSDSTNAERPGYTESERTVGNSLKTLFERAGKRRIIIATFASNVHRVQQIIDKAYELGRKVALSGRSLENVVKIGSELGYLSVPEGELVSIDMVNRYPDDKMVIVTTGSQGEPMSALSRMAFSDHKKVVVGPNDCVIISATPIPGNEKTVGKVVNELLKLGADVIYEKNYGVHVSGHACQEELKLIIGLVKPKYFIPIHGEQKHLRKHAQLAESMGIPTKNILIPDNGLLLDVTSERISVLSKITAGQIFVDGSGVGDVGNVVLKDRKKLSEDGLIVVSACIDYSTKTIISGPEIITRGFVYVKENEELISEARDVSYDAIEKAFSHKSFDKNALISAVRDSVSSFVYEKTRRNPMVLTVLLEGEE